MIKRRIWPEDVTLNLGEGEPVPECPVPGHHWGSIVHNNRATWLANWHESIRDHNKYVWLHASSSIKGSADRLKYEIARKLKVKIVEIREQYTKDLASEERFDRQRATALYLIDKLALRVGGEKGEDEADTVGCCSLRVEHISFPTAENADGREHVVEFDFLGKDSMRYKNAVQVTEAVYRNLRAFVAKKKPADKLFDLLSTSDLNDYLKGFMDGLTAKVFRTYNASFTLQQELGRLPEDFGDLTAEQKVLFYNRANKQVAILCNHQKSVKQSVFSSAIGGLKELLVELVKQRKLLQQQIAKLGGKEKKASKKKKKGKKDDVDDEGESGDDGDDEGKGKKKKKKTKEDDKEAAAAEIDEEAIKSDDSDIEVYRKTREERLKAKAERDKKIKEIEAAEAAAAASTSPSQSQSQTKKEEDDGDGDEKEEPKKKKKKSKKEDEEEKAPTKKKKTTKKEDGEEDGEEAEKEKKEFKVPASLEACETQLERVNERIAKIKLKMVEKGELRNVALGTSKLNYMDPRITIAWCHRVGLKVEKIFQKSLRDKFAWAIAEIEEEVKQSRQFVW